MRQNTTPTLDERDVTAIASELMTRRPAYVPEWIGREGRAGWALLQVFARTMQALVTRLNQAPDKNKLAFLHMLGLSLVSPQAARAPVVFRLAPNAVDGRVPAGSRVAAPPGPGRETPLVFETEAAIGLASAKLAEVVTLWPGRDQYADHSAEAVGGRSLRLFEPLKAVPHVLYLAHDVLFGFAGKSTIELAFDLVTSSSEHLDVEWKYWDGEVWRGFKDFAEQVELAEPDDSVDGTEGLTRSGVVRLATDCAQTAKTKVNGIESFWLQGRLSEREPLPPDPSAQLPVVGNIRLRSVVERPLRMSPAPPGTRLVRDPSCETGCIHGVVQEQSGVPIEGASVCVSEPQRPAVTTDARGYYLIDDIGSGAYTITASFAALSASVTREYPQTVFRSAPLEVDFIIHGLQPDQAFSDGLSLDTAQTFYPFGQQPQPGAAFYFTNEEIFSKPGAEVDILVVRATTPQDRSTILEEGSHDLGVLQLPPQLTHEVAWEYWNGRRWVALAVTAEPAPQPGERPKEDLDSTAVIRFTVPSDMAPVKVNNQEALWMRVRLVSGGFGSVQTIVWTDLADLLWAQGSRQETGVEPTNRYTQILPKPPALSAFRMGYTYRSPQVAPDVSLTYNDFQYEDHTEDVRWPGRTVVPYRPVADSTPALYLGFDRPLPVDRISLYLDIEEEKGIVAGPPLVWEHWDGTAWRELAVTDETAHLRLPGMLSFIAPPLPPRPQATVLLANSNRIQVTRAGEATRFQAGDPVWVQQGGTSELATVAEVQGNLILTQVPLTNIFTGGSVRMADLARFGTPRQWIRGRMKEDGTPVDSEVNGLHLNAVWAAQVQTVNNEVLGASTGQPDQTFSFRQTPVLEGESVEVRELEGVRAHVEFPILSEELQRGDVPEADIRPVRDGEGRVVEVWVRWRPQPHLFFSGPQDRHYVIDRASGGLAFGDEVNGKIPPIGADNVLARRYRFGGGQAGNVPAGSITQLLSGVPAVQAIANPRPAEGGADGETAEAVKTRGPQSVRHRRRALSAQDYEALAREASPGIGAVRALPATDPSGHHAPGWVTIVVLPQSLEREPQPSFELRRRVRRYVEARAPAVIGVPHHVYVTGPDYLPIGAAATIAPLDPGEAGAVEGQARQALEGFLHPAVGGPEGLGWAFGRDVFLSDVAALLEALPGVDYVEELHLLLDGAPQGECVAVPPRRMVVAGDIRIKMVAAEL